ncbi:MAG: GNAT family N-acetyltransferase [Chloroflexi bacterium]|nr:GNAT family N-acetyltransferase [Chloroflexota bacterium]
MANASYPPPIQGHGLVLRPWDEDLVRQMAAWGERGFPYSAFDLGYLKDPQRARTKLAWAREAGPHRHFVACEGPRAVGRLSVNLRDTAGLYLWGVHVPPEHEGRGVCRRMMAAAMGWLEAEYPASDFILTSNAFSERAHHAYLALGFEVTETRWHHESDLAMQLWKVAPAEREALSPFLRFSNGRWEVRTHVMKRKRGAPMALSPGRRGEVPSGTA